MNIYIRTKPKWINFVSPQELSVLIESYTGAPITIGDISLFNKSAIQKLLKLVEENPQIDLYSSKDIECPPLFSRAVRVYKQYNSEEQTFDANEFYNSNRDYNSISRLLSPLANSDKLVLRNSSLRMSKLLISNYLTFKVW